MVRWIDEGKCKTGVENANRTPRGSGEVPWSLPAFDKNGLLTASFFLSHIVNLLFTELSLSIL